MKNKRIPAYIMLMFGLGLLVFCGGCTSVPSETGFLSTYSNLQPMSTETQALYSTSGLVYIDEAALGTYSKFILESPQIHFHAGAKGWNTEEYTQEDLQTYLDNAVRTELSGSYQIVQTPAAGVARIRIAITDIKKDTPALNILPQTKMTGLGLGGASMEGEIVDSRTGKQIAAVVQSQQGNRLSLEGLTTWSSAKGVMDDWAKRLRAKIDEAHNK